MGTNLIVYTSMTGNTEEIANLIGEGILQTGAAFELRDIYQVDAAELQNYDGILLGSYTWGDGDLPDELLDFYEDMDSLNLAGKRAAVFGSCDSSYENRGKAVEILKEKLIERGADIVLDELKIDLSPSNAEKEQCIQFGRLFIEKSTSFL